MLTYLSPSSIMLFKKDREAFFSKYMTEHRPPSIAQTQPMAVGSAFDAYVKSCLVKYVYGGFDGREEFELDAIIEAQVEPQNRDWAIKAGKHIFDEYQNSGALLNLMTDISRAIVEPRFEFETRETVDGVPLLGKPDLFFETPNALWCADFKVNGYCGKGNTSPKAGYVNLVDAYGSYPKQHKNCVINVVDGLEINAATTMEQVDEQWAIQLTIYAWTLGLDPNDEFMAMIEQVACRGDKGDKPELRFARHACQVGADFRNQLRHDIMEIWSLCNSDDFFGDGGETAERIKNQNKTFCADPELAAFRSHSNF